MSSTATVGSAAPQEAALQARRRICRACWAVASIHVHVRGGKRRVTIRGRLSAADLRRLERACGPALEHEEIPLEIRIRDAVAVDETSRLFLTRLLKRGAVLT